MTRSTHIQLIAAISGKPPEGKSIMPAAACGAVGWQASSNHNRLFHSVLNTPSPGRACPGRRTGGGLGRGFFGEPFIEQRSTTSYYTPYTFSAKERDLETGYSFPIAIGIGARYYDADISIWLSVDPMADKYPSMSAYMYCAGNPVILVDPDGREIEPSSDYTKEHVAKFIDRVFKNRDVACGFFTMVDGPNNSKFTTIQSDSPNENRKDLSYRGFKRALRKEVREYNKTHDNNISFSRKEMRDAFGLYQKIDSEHVIKVLCVNSSSTMHGSHYYNLTLNNRTTSQKVANEFSDVTATLFIIEEMAYSTTNPDFWQLVQKNTEKMKSFYLSQITNSDGIKEYPNGSFMLDTTNMKRSKINRSLYNQLIKRQ